MLNLKTKVTTGLATAGVLAASFAPAAFASTDVSVVNNGALSGNHVSVSNSSSTSVSQTNVTTAVTSVSSNANTGGNSSSFNVGGGTLIDTGNATNTTNVTVSGGNNVANLPENCGCEEDTTVDVRRNGAFSHNSVDVSNRNKTRLNQQSYTTGLTKVKTSANTGKNRSSFNVSWGGFNDIWTGNASNRVDVMVESGNNTAN